MKIKTALATALIAGAAMVASDANAMPLYIGYSVNGGAIVLGMASAAGGLNSYSATVGNFTFNTTLVGSPILLEPDLFSSETTVRASGSGAVKIYFSETGLSAQVPGLISGFGNNGNSTVSVTESTYAQKCVVAGCGTFGSADVFATTNLLASQTITPTGGSINVLTAFPNTIAPGDLYNETLMYSLNFAGRGISDATLSLTGTTPVPEPLSLSILGAGVAGIAALRRRRKAGTA